MWTPIEPADIRQGHYIRASSNDGLATVVEGIIAVDAEEVTPTIYRVMFSPGWVDEGGIVGEAQWPTLSDMRTYSRRTAPESPAPVWVPIDADDIQVGQRIRATRIDDPSRMTTGTVSRLTNNPYDGQRVHFEPGAVIESRTNTRVAEADVTVMTMHRRYEREVVADPWILFSWDDFTPTAGDPIKWSGYLADPDTSTRDDSAGEGTFTAVNAFDGVNVQATSPENRPLRGLSKNHRLWYRRTTPTQTEGESPVPDNPQWERVSTSDLSPGDLIRLSASGSYYQFPDALTGTVVRTNVAAPSVDIRLTIGGGGWTAGDVRRSLSTLPSTRRVERATAPAATPEAPATPTNDAPSAPAWRALPVEWATRDARAHLPLQTHVRYHTDGDPRNRLTEGWVTGYGTAGYDFTVTTTEGSRREQYGVNFSWEPEVMASPELAAVIAAVETVRPVYTWSPVPSRETLHPGMVVRADSMDGRRNVTGVVCRVYTEAESRSTWGTARLTGGQHLSFRSPDRDGLQVDLSTAPVEWGSSAVGWANVDRRRIPIGHRVRSLDHPSRDVGALRYLDSTTGTVRIDRESGDGHANVSLRSIVQAWNDGTPQAAGALLSNKDHLTLAGLKAAVFEFAKAEGDMFGQGSNCNAGTNEFLRAIGLPGQTWAPLVDESREIDAFLRQVQEYLSRDSIGISREKADEYLVKWGLPKAPRRRRVNIYATLDGDTTDAQIIERLPRVIRDATNVEVYAA